MRVDLARSDFMESPYYNLKQGCYICFIKLKEKHLVWTLICLFIYQLQSIVVTIFSFSIQNNFNIMSASSQNNQYTNENLKLMKSLNLAT